MRAFILFFSLFLLLPSASRAWWLQNDYSFGDNTFRADSLSVFANISTRAVAGINTAAYKDGGYQGSVYSLRLPLSFSWPGCLVSIKPFYYPRTSNAATTAKGLTLQTLFPIDRDNEGSYSNLMLSISAANQRLNTASAAGAVSRKSFSEGSIDTQFEKTFYNEFFFLASVSAFHHFRNAGDERLLLPALDHSDMAFLSSVRPLTESPSWMAGFQFARNMEPDSDSHVYIGYQRVAMTRNIDNANSAMAGVKIKLLEAHLFDFTYNWWKPDNSKARNYYRLLLRLFF